MFDFSYMGFGSFFSVQLELLAQPNLVPARIAADGRDIFELVASKPIRGRLSGSLRQRIQRRLVPPPTVGDWVAIADDGDTAIIHHVFDRRTQLQRRAAGSEARSQTIAANVDVFFVVTAAGRDFNPRRLERYVSAVWESGAAPVIVLNKIDVAEDLGALLRDIEEAAPTVPVVPVSAKNGDGIGQLEAHLGPGITAAFIGSSGVGKSSLTNRLLGLAQQSVAAVGIDGKGRHTTSRRELVLLADGSALIDTPGLREFGLLEADRGLELTFADIVSFGQHCHFSDCSHTAEPGCAVVGAVANGHIPASRLASYQRLRKEATNAELRRDPAMGANSKKRMKSISRAQRALKASRQDE